MPQSRRGATARDHARTARCACSCSTHSHTRSPCTRRALILKHNNHTSRGGTQRCASCIYKPTLPRRQPLPPSRFPRPRSRWTQSYIRTHSSLREGQRLLSYVINMEYGRALSWSRAVTGLFLAQPEDFMLCWEERRMGDGAFEEHCFVCLHLAEEMNSPRRVPLSPPLRPNRPPTRRNLSLRPDSAIACRSRGVELSSSTSLRELPASSS
jgi:hypothetical protein